MDKRYRLAGAFALVAAASLASCASSGGSTYSRSESSEAAAAARARKPSLPSAPSRPAPPRPGPGPSRPGEDGPSGWDRGEHTRAVIVIEPAEPAPPTGTLELEGLEPDSAVYVDGSPRHGPRLRLPLGSHNLLVRRFGYLDFEATVTIAWDQTLGLAVNYLPADFRIRSLYAVPRSFDPSDPGYLGSCEARIEVSARGGASASLRDPSGRVLCELGELTFAGPSARLRWNGRDSSGMPFPPGDYLIHLEGPGAGDGPSSSADAKVSLVSGTYSRSTALYSGVSGLLFAPDARTIAAGRLELASGAELHLEPAGRAMSGLATAQAGLRIGLPSAGSAAAGGNGGPSGSELDFSYMAALWQDSPGSNSYSLTAAWKQGLGGAPLSSPTAAAIFVKYSIARFLDQEAESSVHTSWDGTTRFGGLSAGLALEYASGALRAFADPELEISTYYPGWAGSGARWDTPGLFSWAYLRLGLEAAAGPYTFGLSGALRSSPFGGAFGLAGPYPLGLELRWHAPSSPLVVSLIATGEFESLDSYYLGAGLGIGLRF
jgi:hypothetical protein